MRCSILFICLSLVVGQLSVDTVTMWAQSFAANMEQMTNDISGFDDIQRRMNGYNYTSSAVDGAQLVQEAASGVSWRFFRALNVTLELQAGDFSIIVIIKSF